MVQQDRTPLIVLQIQIVQGIDQRIKVILRLDSRGFRGSSRRPNWHANSIASRQQQLFVAFASGDGHRVLVRFRRSEQLGEIDLQAAYGHFGASDGWRFVLREDNRILRADPTASRTTFATIVRLLNQNGFLAVDSRYAEQTKVDSLHAIRAAAEVNHRIPTSPRLLVDSS
ncbi:MAG: hypothetical protein KDA55_20195, partial [Planctomycetales bacterium]|nr:hypothetical protein [Planctomycetales bacterium]